MSKPGRKEKTSTTIQHKFANYENVLSGVVELLDTARRASARVVNSLMTATYWEIGKRIVEHEQAGEERAAYGEEMMERMTIELTKRFGRGFGISQLRFMRQFFLTYPNPPIGSASKGKLAIVKSSEKASPIHQSLIGESPALPIHQSPIGGFAGRSSGQSAHTLQRLDEIARAFPLPWTHYVRLLRVRNAMAREFYVREALAGGWSVRQLERQVNSQFYERTALSKNKTTMLSKGEKSRPEDAVSADEEIRNPLLLEFLGLKDEYSENELEDALIQHLETFLLELGHEFAFIGRQKRLRVGHEWFRVDLVFFHRRLRCLLIIDLKIGGLVHADIGQMHLYCNFAREHWMQPGENPPVGLILCTEKNDSLAHYAMEGLHNKMLVREYLTTLPKESALAAEVARTRELLERRRNSNS
ncbi:MAG TPA: PDDEXK nuclease domain-containing protein [Verrucomicrobiae bacterium]|jgi:predicted nuclease of restriction endonuclease-like (RecB) superfamily|nr:PDDEXK nuclease domain-containing protein [Verrucomicrobiae bacterium]